MRTTTLHFDESEKKSLTLDTPMGPKKTTFLTEKGITKLLFKSRKPLAETFRIWVNEIIKEFKTIEENKLSDKLKKELEETQGKHQKELEEVQQQLQEVKEDVKQTIKHEKIPSIYIYNTDTTKQKPELKIGYTTNIHSRIKPYKQVCKHGRLEFSHVIYNKNIKVFENIIHQTLSHYRLQDEVFVLDVEEAKHIIISMINRITLLQIPNDTDRQLKLKKIVDYENLIIHNQSTAISTREISTQTDYEYFQHSDAIPPISSAIPAPIIEETPLTQKFNLFIEECCIIRPDVDVDAKAIEGQYRLWSQSVSKDVFHALHDYLKTRFKYDRLKIQNTKQSHYGFIGVKLKEIEYHKLPQTSNEQNFIFHSCVFSPGGKVLHQDLLKEYIDWKQNVKQPITHDEDAKLKQYLKATGYTLEKPVWTMNGNGIGYYGLFLKSQMDSIKRVSTTGKKVEKRCAKTNEILKSWDSIILAAENENCSAKTISRGIKAKTIFKDDYYFSLSSS
jgi:prophage antirepressor-like protein